MLCSVVALLTLLTFSLAMSMFDHISLILPLRRLGHLVAEVVVSLLLSHVTCPPRFAHWWPTHKKTHKVLPLLRHSLATTQWSLYYYLTVSPRGFAKPTITFFLFPFFFLGLHNSSVFLHTRSLSIFSGFSYCLHTKEKLLHSHRIFFQSYSLYTLHALLIQPHHISVMMDVQMDSDTSLHF